MKKYLVLPLLACGLLCGSAAVMAEPSTPAESLPSTLEQPAPDAVRPQPAGPAGPGEPGGFRGPAAPVLDIAKGPAPCGPDVRGLRGPRKEARSPRFRGHYHPCDYGFGPRGPHWTYAPDERPCFGPGPRGPRGQHWAYTPDERPCFGPGLRGPHRTHHASPYAPRFGDPDKIGERGHRFNRWDEDNAPLALRKDMTPEQTKQFNEIMSAHREKSAEVHDKLFVAVNILEALGNATNPDVSAVTEAANEVIKLRRELRDMRAGLIDELNKAGLND